MTMDPLLLIAALTISGHSDHWLGDLCVHAVQAKAE